MELTYIVKKCTTGAEGAQTVVLLSHIGNDLLPGIVSKTSSIDVVLDAHKHTTEPGAYFKDKDNNDVLWTSTGSQMKNIGRVSITKDGKVKSSLIATESVSQRSEAVGNVVDRYNQDSERHTNEVIGHSDAYLTELAVFEKYTIGGSSYVLLERGDGITFENAERLALKSYLTDDLLVMR